MIRTAQRRFVRHVCLRCLRNLFLLFLLGFSIIHSLQRQVPESHSAFHQLCIMLALCLHKIHAFVQDSGFVSHAEKHNRSGDGVVVSKVSYGKLECAFYHLPGRLLKCVEIEQQLEVGLPALSYPCSDNVTHCRKEICSTCLSKESMPFVKSKPPLPTRSLRSFRAAARSTGSLWLHRACKR